MEAEPLTTDLRSLRAEFSSLAEVLIRACEDLRTVGIPLDDELIRRCTVSKRQFEQLIDGYMASSPPGPSSQSMADRPRTLDHLEELVETLRAAEVGEGIRKRLGIATEKVVRLRWLDGGDDIALASITSYVDSLKQTLATADVTVLRDSIENDPYFGLIQLIEQGNELDDTASDEFADAIEEKFGKKVLRAVLRGKLTLASIDHQPLILIEGAKQAHDTAVSPPSSFHEADRNNEQPVTRDAHTDDNEDSAECIEFSETRSDDSTVDAQPGPAKNDSTEDAPPVIESQVSPGDSFAETTGNTSQPLDSGNLPTFDPAEAESDLSPDDTSAYRQLSPDLDTFAAFQKHYYVDCEGTVVRQPWLDRMQFIEAAIRASHERLTEGKLGHVWVLSKAIECLDGVPIVCTSDLSELARLVNETSAARTSSLTDINTRLRAALSRSDAEPNLLVLMFLQALLGASDFSPNELEIEQLLRKCSINDERLLLFLQKSLQLHIRGSFSIKLISERMAEAPPTPPETIRKSLDERCERLKTEIRRLWSAAGGRIRTTHSRHAWDEFIQLADKVLSPFCSSIAAGDSRKWADGERQIEKLGDQAERICDRRGVLLNDKKRFMRSVGELQNLAAVVVETARELQRGTVRVGNVNESLLPIEELRSILTNSSTGAAWETLLLQILIRVFRPNARNSEGIEQGNLNWRIAGLDLLQYPSLVAYISPDDLKEPLGVEPHQMTDFPAVASHLLLPPQGGAIATLSELMGIISDNERYDLLRRMRELLTLQQRNELARHEAQQTQSINTELRRLRQLQRTLHEMAAPLAQDLLRVIKEAEELLNRLLDNSLDLLMFREWLINVVSHGESALHSASHLLSQRAKSCSSAVRHLVDEKLKAKQYVAALFLMGESEQRSSPWDRETVWRDVAKQEFATPALNLRRGADESTFAKEFLVEWERGYQGQIRADQPLRTKFSRMMFSSTDKDDKDRPRGRNEITGFRISCQAIFDWFTSQKLNPTFVPQLQQYRDIVILTPNEKSDRSSFVERIRSQAASEFGTTSNDLGVFLAPRISSKVREDALREFSIHGLRASIIDDLDICRLLNPGGRKNNLVMGLIELILEQQALQAFSPFHKHDGQHVRPEMFVGRRDQVREIALTTQYSRLFSGRKLGKSALLSYVQQTYDNSTLSSGNTLRVVYVSGVGAGEEVEFVQRVFDDLKRKIGFDAAEEVASSGSVLSPIQRLVHGFEKFCEVRSNESLLILFDEADLFMERQIAEYEIRRENCLSFAIRSNVESQKDSAGLPRVRFLFSGYRVTHKSEGAWTGAWGDVLRLEPLDPEDATTLVRGPLERLGIKCSDIAPTIAWRCGYQPALIIGFCRHLLQHKNLREHIDEEAVSATFEHANVQDEIRSIIDSNFQGNKVGGAVFLTAIWAFSERGAGTGIQELPDDLYRRLSSIESDFGWLQATDEKSAVNQIENIVQDLVRRQLLRLAPSPPGVRTYFARFPHHVPALSRDLVRDPQGRILREIEECKRGFIRSADSESSGSIVSLYSTADIEFARVVLSKADHEFPIKGVLYANDWEDDDACSFGMIVPGEYRKCDLSTGECINANRPAAHDVYFNCRAEHLDRVFQRQDTNNVPILVCGLEALREGLVRELENDELLHVMSLHRIDVPALRWWFNRKRAMEFAYGGLDEIFRATSGVPILVKRLDRFLVERFSGAGANVGAAELSAAMKAFDMEVGAVVEELFGSKDSNRLNARETDILRIVAKVSSEMSPGDELREWLLGWDDLFPEADIAGISPRDGVSIRVLQLSGLLPTRIDSRGVLSIDRFARLAPDDAVYKMLDRAELLL